MTRDYFLGFFRFVPCYIARLIKQKLRGWRGFIDDFPIFGWIVPVMDILVISSICGACVSVFVLFRDIRDNFTVCCVVLPFLLFWIWTVGVMVWTAYENEQYEIFDILGKDYE